LARRPRYPGKNPRAFHHKYKELNPGRYASEVQKVLASGKTPAGMHIPIMIEEVLLCLRPQPGERAIDCTLGGGGHARAILERIVPGGRLVGLDVDPVELPRTEEKMRALGFGPDVFTARQSNFAGVAGALAAEGLDAADLVIADLGVSSMQIDNPDRGFSYKGVGPLDMRMNPARGEKASALIERLSESALAEILREHADEPHAERIARILKEQLPETTQAAERHIRLGLTDNAPKISGADAKLSVRRAFQALRIAVNDEFRTLDALLRALPSVLAPGGRAAIITFHSGEDRRVKKAFQAGQRDGTYSDIAGEVIRAGKSETFANRRAQSAKLRWAVRSDR
jgi:16S rRNA (cytosine1402-N4)-methyltransferase